MYGFRPRLWPLRHGEVIEGVKWGGGLAAARTVGSPNALQMMSGAPGAGSLPGLTVGPVSDPLSVSTGSGAGGMDASLEALLFVFMLAALASGCRVLAREMLSSPHCFVPRSKRPG